MRAVGRRRQRPRRRQRRVREDPQLRPGQLAAARRLVPARLGPAALHVPGRLRGPAQRLGHGLRWARARTPAPTSTGTGSRRCSRTPARTIPTIGDGAYLFDPQGDIRASMIYPCRSAARTRRRADRDRARSRTRTSTSRSPTPAAPPIDLEQYVLKTPALLLHVRAGDDARAGADDPRPHRGDPPRTPPPTVLGHGQADPRQQRRRGGAVDATTTSRSPAPRTARSPAEPI